MNLPQELVDEIINNIPPNGRRSLRNCSLVAKSWLRPSQRHLFEVIEIHQRSLEPWLHNISPTNLELLWHVRQLSYGGYAQDALQPIHRALRNYFPSLSQLRHLTLIFSYVPSHPQEMQLFTAFQHTLSAISLKNCHVTTNASVIFINYFPNLNLFQDRLFLEWKPTPKKSRKTLVHKQNIVMANVHQSVNVLLILTDGSRIPDHGTGYSIVGYYMGEEIHQRSIKFADNASNFDAEMYTLAQAAEDIQRYVRATLPTTLPVS